MRELSKNLHQRNGVYGVRVAIPPDLQKEWGRKEVWRSLKTRDPNEAMLLGAPIRRALVDRIASMRAARSPQTLPAAVAPNGMIVLTPERASKLIGDWKASLVESVYLEAYNDGLPELDGDQRHERAELLYALSQPQPWTTVGDFAARQADVLGVNEQHPALRHSRHEFAEAWLDAETQIDRFRRGDFTRWEPIEPAPAAPSIAAVLSTPTASIKLSDLLERFVTAKKPGEESDLRNAWRRLIEFVGDVDADSVTHDQMEGWVLAVEKFPVTLDMKTIVANHSGENVLSPKSVWKWVGLADRVFVYAEALRLIPVNPLAVSKPKKPGRDEAKKQRRAYTAAETEVMFAKPLFTGFAGSVERGYRKDVGRQVVKDAKYWLPIFALWHGCRMEEIGGAKLDEIKEVDGVTYFDWRQRKLKTPAASRELPIHPKVKKMGFLAYVAERRRNGDAYLFPELPHDPNDSESCTKRFGKWWGRWCDANGFADDSVDFHSFRHTFIEACRGRIDEETRDFIVGHRGQGSMGRSYGGVPVKVLAKALAKVEYLSISI